MLDNGAGSNRLLHFYWLWTHPNSSRFDPAPCMRCTLSVFTPPKKWPCFVFDYFLNDLKFTSDWLNEVSVCLSVCLFSKILSGSANHSLIASSFFLSLHFENREIKFSRCSKVHKFNSFIISWQHPAPPPPFQDPSDFHNSKQSIELQALLGSSWLRNSTFCNTYTVFSFRPWKKIARSNLIRRFVSCSINFKTRSEPNLFIFYIEIQISFNIWSRTNERASRNFQIQA